MDNEKINLDDLGLPEEELFTRFDRDSLESEKITAPRYSYWKSVFRVFFKKKINTVALSLLAIIIAFTYIYPIFAGYDRFENLNTPSAKHLDPSKAIVREVYYADPEKYTLSEAKEQYDKKKDSLTAALCAFFGDCSEKELPSKISEQVNRDLENEYKGKTISDAYSEFLPSTNTPAALAVSFGLFANSERASDQIKEATEDFVDNAIAEKYDAMTLTDFFAAVFGCDPTAAAIAGALSLKIDPAGANFEKISNYFSGINVSVDLTEDNLAEFFSGEDAQKTVKDVKASSGLGKSLVDYALSSDVIYPVALLDYFNGEEVANTIQYCTEHGGEVSGLSLAMSQFLGGGSGENVSVGESLAKFFSGSFGKARIIDNVTKEDTGDKSLLNVFSDFFVNEYYGEMTVVEAFAMLFNCRNDVGEIAARLVDTMTKDEKESEFTDYYNSFIRNYKENDFNGFTLAEALKNAMELVGTAELEKENDELIAKKDINASLRVYIKASAFNYTSKLRQQELDAGKSSTIRMFNEYAKEYFNTAYANKTFADAVNEFVAARKYKSIGYVFEDTQQSTLSQAHAKYVKQISSNDPDPYSLSVATIAGEYAYGYFYGNGDGTYKSEDDVAKVTVTENGIATEKKPCDLKLNQAFAKIWVCDEDADTLSQHFVELVLDGKSNNTIASNDFSQIQKDLILLISIDDNAKNKAIESYLNDSKIGKVALGEIVGTVDGYIADYFAGEYTERTLEDVIGEYVALKGISSIGAIFAENKTSSLNTYHTNVQNASENGQISLEDIIGDYAYNYFYLNADGTYKTDDEAGLVETGETDSDGNPIMKKKSELKLNKAYSLIFECAETDTAALESKFCALVLDGNAVTKVSGLSDAFTKQIVDHIVTDADVRANAVNRFLTDEEAFGNSSVASLNGETAASTLLSYWLAKAISEEKPINIAAIYAMKDALSEIGDKTINECLASDDSGKGDSELKPSMLARFFSDTFYHDERNEKTLTSVSSEFLFYPNNVADAYNTLLFGSDIGRILESVHWILGAGAAGESTFDAIWYGSRISISLAFICAAINMIIGVILGAIWGFSKRVDMIMNEVYNIIGNVPFILVISVMVLVFSPSFWTLVFAMTVTGWLGIAYFIRTQVIIIRDREYNLASKCLGTPTLRLTIKNILPFMTSVIVTLLAAEIPSYISYEVFLSYIGLGMSSNGPLSLGKLIYNAEPSMLISGWSFEFWSPVVIASIITVVLYVVGQNLGDASDPRTHM